ncbi:MAG TPA: hypothetical protein VFV09_03930 [Actinomycetota bacterium]|jgi:hypothetical protein|nr:hypothetical protein [Actinomycetota bacterium]
MGDADGAAAQPTFTPPDFGPELEPQIEVNTHTGLGTSLQDLGLTLPAGLTTRDVRGERIEPDLRRPDPPAESPKRRPKKR